MSLMIPPDIACSLLVSPELSSRRGSEAGPTAGPSAGRGTEAPGAPANVPRAGAPGARTSLIGWKPRPGSLRPGVGSREKAPALAAAEPRGRRGAGASHSGTATVSGSTVGAWISHMSSPAAVGASGFVLRKRCRPMRAPAVASQTPPSMRSARLPRAAGSAMVRAAASRRAVAGPLGRQRLIEFRGDALPGRSRTLWGTSSETSPSRAVHRGRETRRPCASGVCTCP